MAASRKEMPATNPKSKKRAPVVEESESKSESESESVTEEEEEEDDLEALLKTSQEMFTKEYERKIKRTKGKGPSVLPDNTNLYIKLKNNATGKNQWKVVVYGKSNAASDEALKKVEKFLDDKEYRVSYRVEKPRLF
jgi:hypothetical protein